MKKSGNAQQKMLGCEPLFLFLPDSFEDLFLNSFRGSGAKSCVTFIDACAEGVSAYQRGIEFRGIDMNSALIGDESEYRYALYFACSPTEKSMSDDEFIFQCNSANQELCIGVYGDIQNFTQARDLCRHINGKLCYDWEEIVTSLEYFLNLIRNGTLVCGQSFLKKRM